MKKCESYGLHGGAGSAFRLERRDAVAAFDTETNCCVRGIREVKCVR